MKHIRLLVPLILAIAVFFILPLAGRTLPRFIKPALAAAQYMNKGYAEDLDAGRKGEMNVGGYLYLINDRQWRNLACSIVTTLGENGCTMDANLIPQLRAQSAMGSIAMGIGLMYQHQPADLAYWARDTAVSLGFRAAPAYAQGVGFQGLQPILPLWKAFRNLAYAVLALAMVIVGFMVMVRKRIDPKTVMTVQNALPRIVIALILITFSYAIVGFMIDLMYVLMGFISLMFKTALPIPNATLVGCNVKEINFSNPSFTDLLKGVFQPIWLSMPNCQGWVNWWNGNTVGAIVDFVSGTIMDWSGLSTIFIVIMSLVYLFAFVRLLFLLLGCYVQILLAVLTGPIQILMDVFPGGTGFTSWLKNLTSNLIVFPVTAFMLLLANSIALTIGGQTLWVAPFLPQPTTKTIIPGIFSVTFNAGGLIIAFISVGLVLLIPNIVKGIKDAFKAEPAFGIGGGAGGGAGAGAMQILSSAYYFKMLAPSGFMKKLGFGAEEHPTES